ncbi:MAG: Ferrous-iron efflux pump FieF [Firmicutes bacterium ADurb.Bin193]|nr:MAG: Ferrous-iron efflux pump FieF [Firmicutes bacterium ADurb.Bin193]
MHSEERGSIINRASFISIAVNGLLSIVKLLTGVFAYSQAMISDGVDSLGDVLMSLIVITGVNIGKKSKDKNHHYGHEKIESIASLFLSAILLITAVGIGVRAIGSINGVIAGEEIPAPRVFALVVALISVVSKEALFRFAKRTAENTKSTALMAEAWNFRGDALASIGALIGIGGAILGVRILDPIVSIIIALFIVRVSVKIGITGINEVTDHAADEETEKKIFDTIAAVNGVWFVDGLKTRLHGSSLIVDVEIAVNGQISVEDAHIIADRVSDAVYACDEGVKDCMVHVNPYTQKDDSKQ